MTSWLGSDGDDASGIENLPYGVFSAGGRAPRVGVRIGSVVLDIEAAASRYGDMPGLPPPEVWAASSLNPFLALGRPVWAAVRRWLTDVLTDVAYRDAVEPALVGIGEVTMHLPVEVGDYVDFYASEQHAANVGRIFRPGSNPLTPNWKHLPIGYHGRSGTVVVSGTDVVRPYGQRLTASGGTPVFGPSTRLDIEAELGFIVGGRTALAQRVPVDDADEHLFGVVLVNDWSARDIQAWEYVPLGPFLGKSFATSISPWVVPLEALAAAWVPGPRQDPAPLPYLAEAEPRGLDIALEVELNGHVVSRPAFREMYWSPAQLLAHLTVNGASLRTGDVFASGTVSGPQRDQRGSLIELAWNGTEPLRLPDGTERTFLQDGDTVTIRASARGADGGQLGFGAVTGTIAPAPAT